MRRAKKIQVTVQLHEETYEIVAAFLRKTGEPFSGFVDMYVQQMAGFIVKVGLDQDDKKITRADLMKLLLYGAGELGSALGDVVKVKKEPKEKQLSLSLVEQT